MENFTGCRHLRLVTTINMEPVFIKKKGGISKLSDTTPNFWWFGIYVFIGEWYLALCTRDVIKNKMNSKGRILSMKKNLRRNCKRKFIRHFDYGKKSQTDSFPNYPVVIFRLLRPLETIIDDLLLLLLSRRKSFNLMKVTFRRMTFFFINFHLLQFFLMNFHFYNFSFCFLFSIR